MSAGNRQYLLAFLYIVLAALMATIANTLLPTGQPPSVIELWVALMVLHLFIRRGQS